MGVLPDGTRDFLGLWIKNTEGAQFWRKVYNDLKTLGVADILIAVTDGLNVAFSPAVRRVIFTINVTENLHSRLRKIIKTRSHFPGDDAATKLLWLALRYITAALGCVSTELTEAMSHFAISYGKRFTRAEA